jgi:DNA (cytosine-5)-methyltransferase 1
MVKDSCETCQKTFAQKGLLEDHRNRKRPCKKENTIEALIEKKVQEALSKTNEGAVKIETTPTTILQSNQMDYSTKTREELISLCKEMKIKGYSGKKKKELCELLDNNKTDILEPSVQQEHSKIRYIDLFCGLGAFHTAFNKSPEFECVLACDIDDGVRTIYKKNYGLEPKQDIRSLDTASIPDFEILCAGFPCQPFSIAGNGEGFKDKIKGNLFYDILKIIDAKNPKMCILENVKNLKTHDNGKTYKTIETELKNRNYLITSKVINSADYSSPQARHRIFIVATKKKPFTIPEGSKLYRHVSSILDTSVIESTIDWNKYKLSKKGTNKILSGKPHIIFDVISKSTGKGGRQGERVYSTDSVGITVCASSGGPGAKTGLYKVGETIRCLTVKETLGMFGFPTTYQFPDISNQEALFYLGNSIVVNVLDAFVPVVSEWFRLLE